MAKVGQPRKYEPQALEEKFMEYIEECNTKVKFANIEGFSLFAKMDSQTYQNYKKQKEYFATIRIIEATLLDYTIQKGYEAKNPAFCVFYLKNKFLWSDKQEIKTDINANLNKIVVAPVNFDFEE